MGKIGETKEITMPPITIHGATPEKKAELRKVQQEQAAAAVKPLVDKLIKQLGVKIDEMK